MENKIEHETATGAIYQNGRLDLKIPCKCETLIEVDKKALKV